MNYERLHTQGLAVRSRLHAGLPLSPEEFANSFYDIRRGCADHDDYADWRCWSYLLDDVSTCVMTQPTHADDCINGAIHVRHGWG